MQHKRKRNGRILVAVKFISKMLNENKAIEKNILTARIVGII